MKEEIKEILDRVKNLKSKCNYCLKIGKNMYIPRHDKQTDNLIEAICLINDMVDYITNLQERFNALLEAHKIADELETEYQERNEKAIEYIEEHIKYECDDTFNGMSFYSYHLYDFKKDDLLNILKGDKDE